MDAPSCRVLAVVLKNKTESGAKYPEEFASTNLKNDKILEALTQLADDGMS